MPHKRCAGSPVTWAVTACLDVADKATRFNQEPKASGFFGPTKNCSLFCGEITSIL